MMAVEAITDKIDYLQRCGKLPEPVGGSITTALAPSRRLTWIRGIGRPDKEQSPRLAAQAERWRPTTTELITGMYGYRVGLAFQIQGSPAGVRVHLGTWHARPADPKIYDRRLAVMQSVLRGLYPIVELAEAAGPTPRYPDGGIALGVPSPIGIDEMDGAAPIDRIVRAMAGSAWSALVLAHPVPSSDIAAIRESVLNEIRTVSTAAASTKAPSPLTDYYVELLKVALNTTGEAMATGGWRTAVYLLGDHDSYPRLAATWRSLMSSERSLPEPVRVFPSADTNSLAHDWAMPDQVDPMSNGHYRRPFEFQTVLTTMQLATYIHLPQLETPGFTVTLAPRFDVVAKTVAEGEPAIAVGNVLHNYRPTGADYQVSLTSLTRHTFVAGLTGSGKTNTIFSILQAADEAGVPFLIIEPAKTEYRALLEHPRLGHRIRVFTAGKANVSPFVLNPFEVPAGTAVNEHLDLLRAVFSAAFGMWTPLPQILERCLHEVYADRGWDPQTSTNTRLATADIPADAYPTLADLTAKVSDVLPTLGYDDKIAGDFRAALMTRLGSLRHGGKGAMLDVSRSFPLEELLSHPTVIELESMGDEGDKAFVAGLLFIRLAEYRRGQGQTRKLAHLLVIEEAHRLLGNVATHVSEESANPRGQAVETFSNLLSEIRAYGQGVIIADQVPVRLAPDVMKNTNLKIAHRVTSNDDRDALAGAMAMDTHQAKALATLDVGQAAVFSSGDDSPVLVKVPEAKDPISPRPPADTEVSEHMARWRKQESIDDLFLPRPFCADTCTGAPRACHLARELLTDSYVQATFARTVLATVEEIGALDRMWDDLVAVVRARRPPNLDEQPLLRALAGHGADWFVRRRGAQAAWPYPDAADLRDRLQAVLIDKLHGEGGIVTTKLRTRLQDAARRLHTRDIDPYPECGAICAQEPPLCLYRQAAADLVSAGRYRERFRDADEEDAALGERRTHTWKICEDAAHELVEWPTTTLPPAIKEQVRRTALRTAMCFGQQMVADDIRKLPAATRESLQLLVIESEL